MARPGAVNHRHRVVEQTWDTLPWKNPCVEETVPDCHAYVYVCQLKSVRDFGGQAPLPEVERVGVRGCRGTTHAEPPLTPTPRPFGGARGIHKEPCPAASVFGGGSGCRSCFRWKESEPSWPNELEPIAAGRREGCG